MLGNILPPYHSLQELNLDWILTKVKNILRFVPDDGAVGQILRRTAYGAEWSDEQGAGGSVTSVNGQQGAVVLDAADVGALPASTVIPDSTSDLINDSGFVNAAGAAAAAPVQSVNGQTGAVVLQGDIDFMTFTAPSTSFAGNAATDATFTITRAGYTPLCAIPVRTFSSNLVFVGCRIDNINTAVLTVRNLVSSAVTAAPVVGVLFVKNT